MPIDTYDHLPPDGDVPGARGEAGARTDNSAGARGAARGRPYICILFDCCGVYARVYRQPGEPVYRGRCPKCLRTLTVYVAPDGTPQRIFRAS